MAEPSEREKGGGKEEEAEEPDNVSSSSSGIALSSSSLYFFFWKTWKGKMTVCTLVVRWCVRVLSVDGRANAPRPTTHCLRPFFYFIFLFGPSPRREMDTHATNTWNMRVYKGGWNHLVAIDSLSLYTFRLRFICPRWMGWMDVQVSLSLSWHHHQLYEGYND